jgi:pyruvate dehydrogenase E1 component alpha subunit
MKKEEYLDLYRQMVLIRRTEERAAELYQQGKIGGFLHLYIGQEAVSTGLVAARKPQDRMITAYRDHGVAINVGLTAKEVMAELLGKATGMSKGKGGSMHMASVEKNFWGGHAIVGAHLPIAAGMALGDQYRGEDGVTICMFGDGATNIGFFHEGLNLSKVWDLPVLWVCENNQYGMGTAVERASAVSEIRQKAEGYGIPNERVEGMDVLEVKKATEKRQSHRRTAQADHCRCGAGSRRGCRVRREQPGTCPRRIIYRYLRRGGLRWLLSLSDRRSQTPCVRKWNGMRTSSSWVKKSACGAVPTP